MENTQDNSANNRYVVIGRFILEDDGSYTEVEGELVYPIDVEKFTWNRMVDIGGCFDYPDIEHCHFNGAKKALYDGVTFEWNEVGPAHTQEDIDDEVYDDRILGRPKSVNWTDYFPEPHGDYGTYYLKITGYTSDLPEPLVCPDLPSN